MQRNKNSKIAPMEIIMSTKIISLLFFTITSGKQVSSLPQILQISPFSVQRSLSKSLCQRKVSWSDITSLTGSCSLMALTIP